MATVAQIMTEEEFFALPNEDNVERALIRGELVEWPSALRCFASAVVLPRINFYLYGWNGKCRSPRGLLFGFGCCVRLASEPSTLVAVDLGFIGPGAEPLNPRDAMYVDAVPLLVIEVLNDEDCYGDISKKTRLLLDAGVPRVWIVDPFLKTVAVHRPDGPIQLFQGDQTIAAEPYLHGFQVSVAELFKDIND